ncbi:hypothetical protein BH18VER2_BH18VER2_15690 [soil metagenome]
MVARWPGGRSVEWDAEITSDRPNESISWCTLWLAGARVGPDDSSIPDSQATGLHKFSLATTASSLRGYGVGTWKTSSCISLAMLVLFLIIAPRVCC